MESAKELLDRVTDTTVIKNEKNEKNEQFLAAERATCALEQVKFDQLMF